MAVSLSLTVNGKPVTASIEPRTLLVDFLREHLNLTGTHVGCDTAQCGACTVHVDGKAVKACNLLALQALGGKVVTIEGVTPADGSLHPMQAAFREHHGLQCGFCTPGMVMSAIDFVGKNPTPNEAQVRDALDGNLCRCTGYHNIVQSVIAGAKAMRGTP
jgi:aerobic carbon-monoxide dehydrogenase small subunit